MYTVIYKLNNWPSNCTSNSPLKCCVFGMVKIVSKSTDNCWGIAGLWSFVSDFGRNVVIFDVGNTSSFCTYQKKNFLLIGEWPTDGINGNTGAAKRKVFSKAKTKFSLSLRCNGHQSYLFVNKTKTCKFKANDNISWYNFCSERVSKDLQNMNWMKFIFDFSVDHSSIKTEDKLISTNIHSLKII